MSQVNFPSPAQGAHANARSLSLSSVPPFDRLSYFYGQMLGDHDFRTEQSFFREKIKLHNRCLHGHGVVCGLEVGPDGSVAPDSTTPPAPLGPKLVCLPQINIGTGLALDAEGNELLVRRPLCVNLWEHLSDQDRKRVTDRTMPVGFDLKLLSPENVSALPATGMKLVIIAQISQQLHFRIFDSQRKRVVDTDEASLTTESEAIARLKTQLQPLWTAQELTPADKDGVIAAVTSLFGHVLPVTLYVSLCYQPCPIEPTRPVMSEACNGFHDRYYGKIRDSVCVLVSLDKPEEDWRCETCCGEPPGVCELLARVRGFNPFSANPQLRIENSPRRQIGTYVHNRVEGINWVHGAVYREDQAKQLLNVGLTIRFTRPIRARTIHRGILDVLIYTGSGSIRGVLEYLSGDPLPYFGLQLKLMPRVHDVSEIPTSGTNLVVIAHIRHRLYFRIFDSKGQIVVDADETSFPKQAGSIAHLKTHLEKLWPHEVLTHAQTNRVVAAVASIVGEEPQFLETIGDPSAIWFDFGESKKERLSPGDRVFITLRGAFVLDHCCQPLDGVHVGGWVPLLKDSIEPGDGEIARPPQACGQLRGTYNRWTSGNGVPGSSFESWFYVEEGQEKGE